MKKFIGLLVVSFLVMGLMGCGEKIESRNYYYSPTWTNLGKILYLYGLESVRKDALGTQLSSSYSETLMAMNIFGTDEAQFFATTDEPAYAMSYSPVRDYVAYLTEKVGNEYYKIVIRKVTTEAYTGMQKVVLLFSPKKVRSFDWSDDGNKIVYCTSNEVRVRNWDDYNGTTDVLVTSESELKFVSWKYGKRIAFTYGSPEVMSLVYEDGSNRINLPAASVSCPQISAVNTNEVYGIANGAYCLVDASSSSPAIVEVLTNFKGELPRLSPDAKYVVYSKKDEDSGIYLLNINAKSETKIK